MALELAMFFKRNLVLLIVIFALGALYELAMDKANRESWMTGGAVAVVFYFVASLVIWGIKALSRVIYLALFYQKDMTASILGGVRNLKIPAPKRHDEKTMAYFMALANDRTAEISDRLKAASFVAAFEAIKTNLGHFEKLAYAKAADAAVNRFYLEQVSARRED